MLGIHIVLKMEIDNLFLLHITIAFCFYAVKMHSPKISPWGLYQRDPSITILQKYVLKISKVQQEFQF